MKAFFKVVAGEIVVARTLAARKLAAAAKKVDLLVGNDAQLVGSKCESGLPSISPHSATYSPLTLYSTIGQLQTAYNFALDGREVPTLIGRAASRANGRTPGRGINKTAQAAGNRKLYQAVLRTCVHLGGAK